jgi:type IV secretion system protein VirB10
MDTTKQDVIPPNFDSPSWASANAAKTRPVPTLIDPTGAIAVPPDAATVPPAAAAGAEATSATQMTYASKLPPDHPGLRLERPKARSLRKGPLLICIGVLGAFVAIAVIVALTPRGDRAKASQLDPSDSPTKDITLPDAVRDAPDTNADLPKLPRSAPPATPKPAPAGVGAANQSLHEERAKALSSPILVELENPLAGDRGVPPPVQPPAAASGVAPPTALPGGGAGGAADPNMQQHKADFFARDGASNAAYVSQPLMAPRSPYEVKAGTIIPTTLITGINSDLPGQIIGQVRENVYDTVSGSYLLIPQGSRLLATYDSSVSFGQERVLVCWNRLIRPDGISIGLECMPGVDLAGYAGFADEVDNHWFRIITGVALGTLISATAQRSQGDVAGYNPTVPQLWASNAGGAINQAGQNITQKNLAIQPTIKVRPGYSVNVLVGKDIVLVPYNREQIR